MTVAVMQPYVFPYLGYYQLAMRADAFVFLEDVNFITRGWIHRNRILIDGKAHTFTIPLQGASQNRLIEETRIAVSAPEVEKLKRTVKQSYSKCRSFDAVYPEFDRILSVSDSIADVARESIEWVFRYLDIPKTFRRSREFDAGHLKGSKRILSICQTLNAEVYLNPPGGKELYQDEEFEEFGIRLEFIEPALLPYPQPTSEFIPGLSILDPLMRLTRDEVKVLISAV